MTRTADPQPADVDATDRNLPVETARRPERAMVRPDLDAVAIVRQLLMEVPTVEEDPTERMMAALLVAETVEDMRRVFETDHFKDSANRECVVNDFRLAESDHKGRFEYYLLCDVTWLPDGENTVLTVGAEMAMVQLLWFRRQGMLPYAFRIHRKERPTRAGFFPMRFVPLGPPADVRKES